MATILLLIGKIYFFKLLENRYGSYKFISLAFLTFFSSPVSDSFLVPGATSAVGVEVDLLLPHQLPDLLPLLSLVVERPPIQSNVSVQSTFYMKYLCCGSGMFIPGQTFFHPKSRIRTVSIPDPHQKSNKLVAAHIKLPKRKHTVMLTL